VRAAGLVTDGEVERALLVVAQRADGVADVEEHVVLGDVAVGLGEAAGQEVHAVGGAERQFRPFGVDQVGALGSVHLLVVHGHGAARDGVGGGRLARLQVVPGVVADVVGATGLVDAEQVEGAALVGELDADPVAVDGARPVGDPVRVDLAPQHADGRGVAVVGGRPHAHGRRVAGEGEGREGSDGGGEGGHVALCRQGRAWRVGSDR